MPIVFNKKVNENSSLALWQINEDIDFLKNKCLYFLNSDEKTTFGKIKNLQRQKEWLAIRILLKNVLGEYLPVFYDNYNKPNIKTNKSISISHSTDYAGILISTNAKSGFDIEKISEKAFILKNKFLSDEEQKNFIECNSFIYTLLWSAKETLYKIYEKKELIFKENIKIPFFDYTKTSKFEGVIYKDNFTENFELNYFTFNNNILVFTTK